ncbi:MAG: GerMN domain-containing protein [Oscillospiraceae bacterium]|nr:GerMN domain-containing protein [Oscillospiraceae bacterium]
MKRPFCFLLVLLMLFSLAACSQGHADPRDPVTFYYRAREYGLEKGEKVISSEPREAFGHREDYVYLVDMYLQGPTTQNCISPFPAGTTLEQLDFMSDTALIQLSSHISLISGVDLTIACVCLGKTVCQMTGMKSARISAKGDLLDGQEYITITEADFRLLDDWDYNSGK